MLDEYFVPLFFISSLVFWPKCPRGLLIGKTSGPVEFLHLCLWSLWCLDPVWPHEKPKISSEVVVQDIEPNREDAVILNGVCYTWAYGVCFFQLVWAILNVESTEVATIGRMMK